MASFGTPPLAMPVGVLMPPHGAQLFAPQPPPEQPLQLPPTVGVGEPVEEPASEPGGDAPSSTAAA
jgi:hypothetical protein